MFFFGFDKNLKFKHQTQYFTYHKNSDKISKSREAVPLPLTGTETQKNLNYLLSYEKYFQFLFTLPPPIMEMEKWSLQNWFPFILGNFLVGGFNPFEKYYSKTDHFPQVRVKMKVFETTT